MIYIMTEIPRKRGLLVLMRGLPSAGKSYEANKILEKHGGVIVSADHYWGKTLEEYKANFCFEKLFVAHRTAQVRSARAMFKGESPVIVDNTNIKHDEMFTYIAYAMRYGYGVAVAEPTSEWWQDIRVWLTDKDKYKVELENVVTDLVNKNQHGVPSETFQKMINGWESDLPTFSRFCRYLMLRG